MITLMMPVLLLPAALHPTQTLHDHTPDTPPAVCCAAAPPRALSQAPSMLFVSSDMQASGELFSLSGEAGGQ